MKIKILIEGLIAIVLTPFLNLDNQTLIIVLALLTFLQIIGFFTYKWNDEKKNFIILLYTFSLCIYYIELTVLLDNQNLLLLFTISQLFGQVRHQQWNKLSLLLNLYALFRLINWSNIDVYSLSSGVAMLIMFAYTQWAYSDTINCDNEQQHSSNYSLKRSYERSILQVVQTPEYKKQQIPSSTMCLQQQELQDCFHFFNLIPDSLVLLTVSNLSVHFCNAATLELFSIPEKSCFLSCLEQLTDIMTTQNKQETRDQRDSFPSFQSFQQTFQKRFMVSRKFSREEIDLNLIIADLKNLNKNRRLQQVLRSNPHSTMPIGTYLANWNESTGCSDLETPQKRLLELNAHATMYEEKLMVLLQIRDVTHRTFIKSIKKSYQAKSDTISFVSHEIRTPLNAIIQFVSALQDEHDPIILSKYARISLANCKYLLNLSNYLLDFAQIKAGKFSIHPSEMDLKKLIEECLEVFQIEAALKKITLNLIYKTNVPHLLKNDPNRVRQVIFNLLGNAFKYTLHGIIEIKVQNYRNNQIKVEVHDTGLGIKEENKENLMHAFATVQDNENKKLNPQGVGLGLLISNMIVRNLSVNSRGLQFQSEYQQGSVFWFYLNKDIQDEEIQEESGEDIEEESPERRQSLWRYNNIKNNHVNNTSYQLNCACANILIVDDNAFNLEVLKFLILKINNSLIIECSFDGVNAIEMVKHHRCNNCKGYQRVFMDIEMPSMNGLEATQIIKRHYPDLKIIGCSGYAKEQEEQQALEYGMDGYLVKPIQLEQLKPYLAF